MGNGYVPETWHAHSCMSQSLGHVLLLSFCFPFGFPVVYPSNTADPRVALKTVRVPGFLWLQLPPARARLRARGGLPPGLGAGAGGLAAGPGAAPRGGADAAAPGVRRSTKSAGGTAAFAGGNEGMSRAKKMTRGAFGHHLGDIKKDPSKSAKSSRGERSTSLGSSDSARAMRTRSAR